MQFFIDRDAGSYIAGWLIPDNPGDDVEFVVSVPDSPTLTVRANILRPDLVALGMHPTGMAGFLFDDSVVPGIETMNALSISDAQSGLTIYRRFDGEAHISLRMTLLLVGGMPPFKILRRCSQRFALSYPVIERLPFETVGSLLASQSAKSMAVFGQVNWMRLGALLQEQNFLTFALLRDPFEELAERLLFLKLLSKRTDSQTAGDLFARNRPLMPLVAAIDADDNKKLLAALRKLEPAQRRLLRSPMTATLACMPDEEPQRRHVSLALDQLAKFSAIGVRSHFSEFATLADAIIGEPMLTDVTELDALPGTHELARRLASMGIIEDMLDEDVALYFFVNEALREGYRVELPDAPLHGQSNETSA